MLCRECLRVNAHHPNCPNAEDEPDEVFTVWVVGRPEDIKLTGEDAMRRAAKLWGFDADLVIENEEADIVNETGIVIGGCYKGEVV
tara:strand:+ start:481 stop:738 length:258 start_codon:yes stop_codon:yes gene_type:complete